MAKKQAKKSVTIDELAGMVARGFQGVEERIGGLEEKMNKGFQNVEERFQGVEERFQSVEERFQGVEERFQSMEKEMRAGFTRLDASLGRHGQRTEYHDDEIFALKSRLKVVEKKVGIKPPR